MKIKHLTRLGFTALIVAWCFDLLFWNKETGISFFIFILLCLVAVFFLTWQEHQRPAMNSMMLIVPVLFFAVMTFLRQEPFTLQVNYLLTTVCMMILVITWLGGHWVDFSLSDYVIQFTQLVRTIWIKPLHVLFSSDRKDNSIYPTQMASSPPSGIKPFFSILLGLVLAFPVVALLATLLASADPIFSGRMTKLLSYFDFRKVEEYFLRLMYISACAYFLSGAFIHSLLYSHEVKLSDIEKPWLQPFLGWLEGIVILFCVDLLFFSFVMIQFKYFFGGKTNITTEGFTYAEYARRGFSELVAVAVISLFLFLGLSMVTRRTRARLKTLFSSLEVGLVILVIVILISAFQRLLLYESAYGFTRLRTYTHVFMIWLGILLLATVLLELIERLRRFALAFVLVILSYGLTLNLLNIDDFIVRQNLALTTWNIELDSAYLDTLSDDAVPVLVEAFQSSQLPAAIHDDLGALLACRAASTHEEYRNHFWLSFQWPSEQAKQLYQQYQTQLDAYPVRKLVGKWMVTVRGNEQPCYMFR